ncbi:MAG: IS1595 family transposase [Planctomycetes bacterium]|nr:IS1595 family transposase [Planctomycetota bacterium]
MATKKLPQLAKSPVIAELPVACADEAAGVEFFERKRWGDCPCCPNCGDVDVYQMKDRKTGQRNKDFRWRCRGCSKLYSVRTGTVFEESLLPMHKWARAVWEASVSKNGVSALELSRKLEITYKSALFMMNRLRFAMQQDPSNPPKLTGTVEADETYWGGRPRHKRKGITGNPPGKPKTPVFAAIQRNGEVRARVLPSVTAANLREALTECVDPSARLVTDDLNLYWKAGKPFARHDRVKHSVGEYVNKEDPTLHSNTIESFFARLKRKLHGTHHNVSKKHLHRYVTEAAFMYNTREMNDGERVESLIRQTNGKRLVYRDRLNLAG